MNHLRARTRQVHTCWMDWRHKDQTLGSRRDYYLRGHCPQKYTTFPLSAPPCIFFCLFLLFSCGQHIEKCQTTWVTAKCLAFVPFFPFPPLSVNPSSCRSQPGSLPFALPKVVLKYGSPRQTTKRCSVRRALRRLRNALCTSQLFLLLSPLTGVRMREERFYTPITTSLPSLTPPPWPFSSSPSLFAPLPVSV